jgi:hypothetical protein
MQIEIDVNTVDDLHCVYTHSMKMEDGSTDTFYIGVVTLKNVMEFPDARRNTLWRQITRRYRKFTMKIEYTGNYQDCKAFGDVLIVARNPACNQHGIAPESIRGTPVRCLANGQEYLNARDAAYQNNISISAMSNHLNGRPGYERIHGKVFERINEPRLDADHATGSKDV